MKTQTDYLLKEERTDRYLLSYKTVKDRIRTALTPSRGRAKVYQTRSRAETAMKYLNQHFENIQFTILEDVKIIAEPTDTVCQYCGSRDFYVIYTESVGEYWHYDDDGNFVKGLSYIDDMFITDPTFEGYVDDKLFCHNCGKFFREMTIEDSTEE